MRLMRTGAKLRAELSVSLPAELKTGETETTGCICCGLLFVLPADIFCGFAVVFWRKYDILYIQLATCNLTHFVLYCICERRDFFRGTSHGCAKHAQLLFLQNCRQKFSQQCKIPGHPSAIHRRKKKFDKNLHQQKNLVYYICKREGQLLPIRQTDSPSKFLSFYVCAAAQSRGLFDAGRIRHTVCIKQKKKGKNL